MNINFFVSLQSTNTAAAAVNGTAEEIKAADETTTADDSNEVRWQKINQREWRDYVYQIFYTHIIFLQIQSN
jgi:hypothetical protein